MQALLGRFITLMWGLTVTGLALSILSLGQTFNVIQILNILMYPFTGVLLGAFWAF